ncbi:chain-length determining protein [Rheinheimera sp. UJ51]|uniref:chain-length determining protein n=1 Tax=Rheinheimera sp. UJ51 TaxID=2892446 RepID=UPI001E4D7A74|nr:chain-length determining protein [Rheinheimera sp. UJ51]MCC5450299.1 chain-length determining protein [Rheinheimera sp. UJ51]
MITFARTRRRLAKHPHWALCLLATFFAIIYWGLLATNRYVSETHIVLQSPEINPTGFNISSLLSGTQGSGDLLLLKDHLESVDMLQKLQQNLNIRAHYANSDIDMLSRLSDEDIELEKLYKYMQSRIDIVFDDYAAVLRIRVQAYSPDMAKAIAQTLLDEGERHMNEMGQRLAAEQVAFIEEQVQKLETRLFSVREELLAFQNKEGLVSPTGTVQSIFAVVSQLQGQLALLEARKKSAASFQSTTSPEIVRLNSEIAALKAQIDIEKSKLAATSGDSLNRVSAEYQTLELRAQFALELYSNSLMALESTRVEAARKLKQVSVLQYPTQAEFSTEPRRGYNILVFMFFALFAAAITHLARAIIRDHRD